MVTMVIFFLGKVHI